MAVQLNAPAARLMMRREFLRVASGALCCAVAGVPLAGCGAATPTVRKGPARIGFLGRELQIQPLAAQLRALGYVDGENAVFEPHYTTDQSAEQSAAELAHLNLDVIVAFGENAALAAQKATSTIPIVVSNAFDLVGRGLVASLARPGGNITGPTSMVPELGSKWLELLQALTPGLSRVAAVWNNASFSMDSLWKGAEPAARSMGQRLNLHPAPMPVGMAGIVQAVTVEQAEAIVVLWDFDLDAGLGQLLEYATRNRIPTISQSRNFAAAGGLLVYGPDMGEARATVARYVDRILKGAKPADLPVEQPTKFSLIVNLKTAAAMNLTVPQAVLAQATEVIQ